MPASTGEASQADTETAPSRDGDGVEDGVEDRDGDGDGDGDRDADQAGEDGSVQSQQTPRKRRNRRRGGTRKREENARKREALIAKVALAAGLADEAALQNLGTDGIRGAPRLDPRGLAEPTTGLHFNRSFGASHRDSEAAISEVVGVHGSDGRSSRAASSASESRDGHPLSSPTGLGLRRQASDAASVMSRDGTRTGSIGTGSIVLGVEPPGGGWRQREATKKKEAELERRRLREESSHDGAAGRPDPRQGGSRRKYDGRVTPGSANSDLAQARHRNQELSLSCGDHARGQRPDRRPPGGNRPCKPSTPRS